MNCSDGHDGADKPTLLTASEKDELSHLRREVKVLRMERETLKRRPPLCVTRTLDHVGYKGATPAISEVRKVVFTTAIAHARIDNG